MHRIVLTALVWKRLVFLIYNRVTMVLRATVEKKSSEQSLSKVSSEAAIRSWLLFKMGVLKNFATVNCLCWSLFLIKLKKRLQHWSFLVNIAKFLRTVLFIEQLRWLLLSAWSNNCSVLGICRLSLINQEHDVGWFLLK